MILAVAAECWRNERNEFICSRIVFGCMRAQGTGMIRILTVEREYGSGGGEIAQLLAKQLGWKLWDQDLTEEIARLANCPKAVVEVREERTDPLYYRLFKSFLRGSYEGSLNAHKLNVVDSESILKITE